MPAHERFKRPLIVAVNKYDSWEGLIPDLDLRQISPYAERHDGTIGIDMANMISVSRQVQSLIRETSPEIVAACESFCDDITFVPISPQGCSPVRGETFGLGVRPGDMSPVWAEVPLLYSISKVRCALLPTVASKDDRKTGAADMPTSIDDDTTPHIYRGTG
jgi:hypothetical protein